MSHIFTSKGIVIDTEKARAVLEMEPPTDVEGVQRLNGFVNFLTKFPPRLADVMEPIHRLTRKEVKWSWGEKQRPHSAKSRSRKLQFWATTTPSFP